MPFKEQRMSIEEQTKIHDIAYEQQHRIAVDMSDKFYVKNYDEDFYSLKRTKEENKLISKALSETVVSNLVLTKENKAHLRNLRSRNKSHILLNQHKLFGDSELMANVKNSIHLLEQSLVTGKVEEGSLNNIEQNYKDAIRECMTYCDKKNPWFPKGKERKRLVANRLRALKKELGILRFARKHNDENPDPGIKSPLDLLELGRVLMPDKDVLLPDEEFLKDDHIIEKEVEKEEPIKEEKKEENIKVENKKEEIIKEEKKDENIKDEKKEENIKEGNKKEEEIIKEENKKEEIKKEDTIKKEENIKKNENPNDGGVVNVKWLKFKNNGDASWGKYVSVQKQHLRKSQTNKLIKDKEADQQVIDTLCKHWTYLSHADDHMKFGSGEYAYDDPYEATVIRTEVITPMLKAFSIETKTYDDKKKVYQICAERYKIEGSMYKFLFGVFDRR